MTTNGEFASQKKRPGPGSRYSSYILFSIRNRHSFNTFHPTNDTFPDFIRIKCVWLYLRAFLHLFFPWLMHISVALSSVLTIRLSRIRW